MPWRGTRARSTFFADAVSTDAATLKIETSAPGGPEEVSVTATVVDR